MKIDLSRRDITAYIIVLCIVPSYKDPSIGCKNAPENDG
jgi:hypothetical protein